MANISGTDGDIQNWTSIFCIAIPPTLGEDSSVNFGPLITEIRRWDHTHPNQFFRKILFQPLDGAAPQIFTRVREWPSLASAPLLRMGLHLTIFFKGGSKIGWKFDISVPVAFWVKRIPPWNFATWRALGEHDHLCTNFWGPAPQKFGRAIKLKIWSNFGQLSTLTVNT